MAKQERQVIKTSGERAMITDIQRFSVHDGTGIRTMIFFKGCPLRCQWCQNPETRSPYTELLLTQNRSINCGACEEACESHAVISGVLTDRKRCTLCGSCTEVCCTDARKLAGRYYDMDTVLEKILSDRTFYRYSEGGVTLSGGEPAYQAGFARNLLSRVSEEGIHTAVETCGACSWAAMESILEYTDMVLYDVKHTDSLIHKKYTGMGNEQIIQNLLKIGQLKKTLIIRIPFIPGVNDGEENLVKTAEYAKLCHAKQVHILPFHQMGLSKWTALDEMYEFAMVKEPDFDTLQAAMAIFESEGLSVNVGGYGN